ncbi:MAG: DUF5678 domain-containing protein [Byssovorax sp.]
MATTAIGVRELKLHAPALVKRASSGERIVITRYGKPHAQLGPLAGAPGEPSGEHPRLAAWRRERSAFEQLAQRLEARYRGRYVAVYEGRVVGTDRDPEALYERMWKKLGGRTFFIGRAGAPAPIVDMPGFEVE